MEKSWRIGVENKKKVGIRDPLGPIAPKGA